MTGFGHVDTQIAEEILDRPVGCDQNPLVLVPPAQHLKVRILRIHHRRRAQRFRQPHIEIAPANQRKVKRLVPIQLRGALLRIWLLAGDGGQQRRVQVGLVRVQFFSKFSKMAVILLMLTGLSR